MNQFARKPVLKGEHAASTAAAAPLATFDSGEIAILRAYFGLGLRKNDPPLRGLYVQIENEPYVPPHRPCPKRLRRPIRLVSVHQEGEFVTDLSHAVARICLSDIQQDLPNFVLEYRGTTTYGRYRFEQPRRPEPLQPQYLLRINWALSRPGISWPEEYRVTFVPGFNRCVVTASTDSTDAHEVTDFAIGWFNGRRRVVPNSKQVILKWWSALADDWSQSAWHEASGGLINADDAWEMRKQVWPDADDDADDEDAADEQQDSEVTRRMREAIPEQWVTFERDLVEALGKLGDDGFLVISHAVLPRYVQFAGGGEEGLRAEAIGNAWLAESEKLGDAQLTELQRSGWSPPIDGDPGSVANNQKGQYNFHVNVDLPAGAKPVAALAVHTLRDVFGVSAPTDLRYRAFRARGERIEAIDSCLRGVPPLSLYLGYPGAWVPQTT